MNLKNSYKHFHLLIVLCDRSFKVSLLKNTYYGIKDFAVLSASKFAIVLTQTFIFQGMIILFLHH